MSFDTSNLQADTIYADIHYVNGIPLSNNTGNLKLGDEFNSVVECLELQANAQLSTPLAIITGLSIDNIVPYSGIGGSITLNGSFNMNNYGITGADVISGNTLKNTNNSFNVDASGNITANSLNLTYQLQNVYYVSPNGNDTSGTGSINNPYQTIQKAVDIATALTISDNVYRYILVQAGNYNENLSITSKINIIGLGTSPFSTSVGCVISGSININVSQNGSDMFNNCVNISGLLIGSLVSFVSTKNSILNIENCYLYSDDNVSGRALYFNPTALDSRLRITNTQIISGGNQGLDPLVEITKGSSTTMNNVIINSKGEQYVMMFSGTATCDNINNCKFVSDVNSSTAPPIVGISATNSGTYTFTNCGFIYGSTISKAGALSTGIRSFPASGNPRIIILYCSFFLLGTTTQQYAVADQNHMTPYQIVCLYYMNNASLNNAFAINANNNQNKFQLQIVS